MKKEALEKIRIARIVKGYSQEYIAQKLKITQSQYSRLENGTNKISKENLERVCSILELTRSDLVFDS
ncbi:MAG TPA: helix-turn-helix transcriptional regulator [Flavobacterium sp.]|nr:helix-turn-helix transcriptional regulator [Flavobacterium sp.]